jgi:hypothetical protein
LQEALTVEVEVVVLVAGVEMIDSGGVVRGTLILLLQVQTGTGFSSSHVYQKTSVKGLQGQ